MIDRKPTTVINVDTPTYEALKKASVLCNHKSLKAIVEEVTMMTIKLLDGSPRNDDLIILEKMLRTAPQDFQKIVRGKNHTISLQTSYSGKLRSVRTFYNLSYNQLLQSMLPFYVKVHVMHTDEREMVKHFNLQLSALDPQLSRRIEYYMYDYNKTIALRLLNDALAHDTSITVDVAKVSAAIAAVHEPVSLTDDDEQENVTRAGHPVPKQDFM